MKNKVLIFIIGVLVGAIIATLGFYLFYKNDNKNVGGDNTHQMMRGRDSNGMPEGEPPELPDGENSGEMPEGEPPELPDGENGGEMTDSENNNSNGKFKQRPDRTQNTTNNETDNTENKT